jgi:hypothetical protein
MSNYQIKQISVRENWDKKYLIRKPEIEAEYINHLAKIKASGKTPTKYIIDKYEMKIGDWLLTENEYPYSWPEDFQHNILWIYTNNNQNATEDEAITFIRNYYPNQAFFLFENLKKEQSVKEMQHFHVIFF